MHLTSARKMRYSLYILLLMVCGSVYGQPTLLHPIASGSKNFVNINGRLYYSSGSSLYTASVTTAPVLVANTGENILRIHDITVGPNFFFVTESASGQSLWRTDGTTANTVKVTTQTQITPLLAYNSELYMRVNSASTGVELWKMDAAYNAGIVKDINPGTANGFYTTAIVFNNLLYFFANSGTGQDLWKSNGTPAGTVMAVNLDDADVYLFSGFHSLTAVNDVMYYTADYEQGDWGERVADLWKTNGTQAGTTKVVQFTGGHSYNYLSNLLAWKGKLYFFHNIGDPQYHYISVSNGTAAGTRHIDLTTIDGSPRRLIDGGDYVLYYAESQGNTTPIEKTDGTNVSLVHQFSYYHSTSDANISLTATGGRAFFLDDVQEYYGGSSELWQADLASGVTQSVAERYGFSLSGSGNIVADNGNIYFTRVSSGQMTLWYHNPNNPPGTACTGAGSIEREKWVNITGTSVSTIPYNTKNPSSITSLTSFSTPQNEGDNYGSRIRGYLCVPETGNYTFYISSDDNSELWLSTDETRENKRLIASSKWTRFNEWNKYPTQQSAEIPLVKGQKYYIEALHKEATGADHLSVGWKLPDGTLERPIPGSRLIPIERDIPPVISLSDPYEGETFIAPATVDMTAYGYDDDGQIVNVSFYASGTYLGSDNTEPYQYKWENVPVGDYTIEARATDDDGNIRTSSSAIKVTAPSCNGNGGLYQEFWVNATGTDVRTFDFSTNPNGGSRYFTSFETTQYYSNNYASRMRGMVCVPQTGNYTFWISSDDYSELYLSTDENEGSKKLIAWVYGATPFRNYDKYSSQKSAQIYLEAGRKYYIEARHKEGTGNDFISVGWTLPDGTLQRPIPGDRLISTAPPPNYAPSITMLSPQPNENFTAPATVKIAAEVTDPDGVRKVTFAAVYGGIVVVLAEMTSAPYEYTWEDVEPGSYELRISAEDGRGATGYAGLHFSVSEGACAGTGKLVREIWTGISGTSISSIPLNAPPNRKVELTSFSTPNYYGNDYGSRIRGYVCVPESGAYTFWISGDDNSELWLSSNDDPAGKTRIAYATSATAVNQWGKYATQKSALVNLVKGQRYYIEVLHKEANGADHVEVGWQLPSGVMERPIGGNRVIPFEDASTAAAAFATEGVFDPEEESTMTVYPNPAVGGNELSISLSDGTAGEVDVDIISMTGVSVQRETLATNGSEVRVGLKSSVTPGMYLIKVADQRRRWMKKIQVK